MDSQSQELLDGLIATYRELNNRVRPLNEDRLRVKSGGGASVREVITRMRDDELQFSQALKERLTGVAMPEMLSEDERPILGTEHEGDTTAVILSQFGTARESTLAMLRTLSADEWNREIEGGRTISVRIREVVASDRKHVEQINALLGAP